MIKFGIGQAVRRVEDQRFLTGQGRYVDDITLPGMCHGVNVLSPHAHARIKTVDVSKARAAPGVLLVLTGADLVADHLGAFTAAMMPEDLGAPKGHRVHQQLLQSDKARFVGDRIAFVVAETLAQARDAAELVEVDYEPLPAVALLEDAAKEDAPKVWDDNPNGNVAFQLMIGDQAATDAAFAKAKHHVKLRIENNRLAPASMEPRTAIGDYNTAEDSYTLYTSSQNPHGARTEIAHVFHIAENQLRVVAPDVGGGFGLKGGVFPDDALVLWASKKLRRPVKWVATRSEAMMTDHTGRDLVSYGEMALDEKGKILAIRSQALFQVGAYFVGPGMVSGLFSMRFIPEAYDVQTIHVMCKGLFTNTPQAGPYRGAGRPEAAYFTERMIEHAAKQIGMDVAVIRRVNLISPDKFPYTLIKFNEDEHSDGDFAWLMRKHQCMHCADPGCLHACPADGAIVQYENGIVDFQQENCIGCQFCVSGCPFNIPKYDPTTKKVYKCTLCSDRVGAGLEPACIKACPTGCLHFGTKDDMKFLAEKRATQLREVSGFKEAGVYDPPTIGGTSVIYVLHASTRPRRSLRTDPFQHAHAAAQHDAGDCQRHPRLLRRRRHAARRRR